MRCVVLVTLQQVASWCCSHLKAPLGVEGSTSKVVPSHDWQVSVRVNSSPCRDLHGLLECPCNMVPGFLQSKQSKKTRLELPGLFWPTPVAPIINFAVFYCSQGSILIQWKRGLHKSLEARRWWYWRTITEAHYHTIWKAALLQCMPHTWTPNKRKGRQGSNISGGEDLLCARLPLRYFLTTIKPQACSLLTSLMKAGKTQKEGPSTLWSWPRLRCSDGPRLSEVTALRGIFGHRLLMPVWPLASAMNQTDPGRPGSSDFPHFDAQNNLDSISGTIIRQQTTIRPMRPVVLNPTCHSKHLESF